VSGSLRHSLRCFAAEVLHGSGSLRLYGSVRRKLWPAEVCVLGLHRVLPAADYGRVNSLEAILMRESTFGEMLAYLKQRFQVISLEAFLEPKKRTRHRAKPLCLITFDDGWRDNYTTALPLLQKFGLPAVIFLATASMGKPNGFWVEQVIAASKDPARSERLRLCWQAMQGSGHAPFALETAIEILKHMSSVERDQVLAQLLAPANQPAAFAAVDSMLTWEEAREMAEAGIEIGSHTVHHPLLPYEDDGHLRSELAASKQIIEDKIGRPVNSFAYPNGTWDERVRKQTAETGYRCAFTTGPGWFRSGRDLFAVPRVLLHEGNVTGGDGKFSPGAFEWTLASGG
jgi:peptidoglycan/xylan/chitin deacetylase (PgdA/CDA1 family)